jgi:hypothetical protein
VDGCLCNGKMDRFWNNIATMRPDSLHYKLLMSDHQPAIVERIETFGGTLMQQLRDSGHYFADKLRCN